MEVPLGSGLGHRVGRSNSLDKQLNGNVSAHRDSAQLLRTRPKHSADLEKAQAEAMLR